MSLDFTHSGEARVTMAGYVDEVLRSSGVTGTARTPASDRLFETGESVLDQGESGQRRMYANVLTKPLQGSQFVYERWCLTGWEMPFGAK